MITIAEELLLLTLDDEGSFVRLRPFSMELALAGAVLMELALRDRIDTDLEQLMITDPTPTGDETHDAILEKIGSESKRYSARHWLKELYQNLGPVRRQSLDRLVSRGILREEEKKFLWVFGQRRYPTLDDTERQEAKLRILGVLFRDEFPDPRDVFLICLADACSIFEKILSRQELRSASSRIEQIKKMDLIGREMARMLEELHTLALRDPATD